jgi:3-methyladenine DNA glycosylase AlkD
LGRNTCLPNRQGFSIALYGLNYKTDLDTKLLSHCINALLDSKEFFINKAIGWILRQYSISNPDWVLAFVAKTDLNTLSKKEALRLMK